MVASTSSLFAKRLVWLLLALGALSAAAGAAWAMLPLMQGDYKTVFSVKLNRGTAPSNRIPLADISAMAADFTAVGADMLEGSGDGITPKTAWERNASRAFGDRPVTPASAFSSRLSGADLYRAEGCLAIAGLYEAGLSRDDQRPVMQVVLNRVRHPAWPSSVCGVVFQGAARASGCQFSFTCDGSMKRRRFSDQQYQSAKTLAATMLRGATDPRVGWSTHYHTDWVYPYWSDSLDKTAAINTHVFFRWPGYWGTKPAFVSKPSGSEPAVGSIAVYDIWHDGGASDEQLVEAEAEAEDLSGSADFEVAFAPVTKPAVPAPSNWQKPLIKPITADMKPGRWALDAVALCGNKASCRVVGWSAGRAMPAQFDPESLKRNPPDIVYQQELRNRTQQVYWDCGKWAQAGSSKCIGSSARAAELALLVK
ncbi:MAG: cell wall hydrolase [Pseudomonadota bacterium]